MYYNWKLGTWKNLTKVTYQWKHQLSTELKLELSYAVKKLKFSIRIDHKNSIIRPQSLDRPRSV